MYLHQHLGLNGGQVDIYVVVKVHSQMITEQIKGVRIRGHSEDTHTHKNPIWIISN